MYLFAENVFKPKYLPPVHPSELTPFIIQEDICSFSIMPNERGGAVGIVVFVDFFLNVTVQNPFFILIVRGIYIYITNRHICIYLYLQELN